MLVVLLLVFLKEAGCFSRGRPQATMPRKPGSAVGRDTSTVEVSRLTEGQIMRVLKERDGAGQALEHAGTKKVGKVWDELVALGFTQELAARALERTPTVSVPDCLDWLCLNVEEDQLPRRFRSSYRAAEMADGAVTVVAPPRASQAHADAQAAEAQEDEDPVAAAAAAAAAAEKKRQAEAERAEKAREEAAREAEERKAWILKMSGAGGGDVSDDEEGSDDDEEEEEEEEEEDLADKVNDMEARLEVLKIKGKSAKGKEDIAALQAVAAEGRTLTQQLEALHAKLTASAQGACLCFKLCRCKRLPLT